ncbi:MAG: 50S ribosomal protein L10, partial [Patescibacteria group bacterium]|nr:50S ribosomal protein L10 [Patescibacteria group bacterium]
AEVIEKIEGIAKKAKTLVFANFKGLTVAEQNEMRKNLRAQGIGYTVAKKTLLRRALGSAGFAGEAPALEGEIALAYGEDELAPAREVGVFVKKFGDHLSFVGGVFGGRFVGKDEIISISAIPGMDALRAQFVQLINSPLQRFAVVLNAKADKGQ